MATNANKPAPRRRFRRFIRRALLVVIVGAVGLLAFLFFLAYLGRGRPPLEAWHTRTLTGEFRAKDESATTLTDYMALEDKLFAQIASFELTGEDAAAKPWAARYIKDGPFNPATHDRNWNRTTILEPTSGPIRGGALLIHGCSDSPYSLRAIGQAMQKAGWYVVCIRLPGHGTVPSGLLDIDWRDWAAATRIAGRHVKNAVGADQPFVVGGYSLGGALAIRYAIDAIDDNSLPKPQRLFLFSPAVGVSGAARLAEVSLLPAVASSYFEKSRWVDIAPEYDPYKYNSFTKRAGYETWGLTVRNIASLERLSRSPATDPFPPITCFVSTVDATVHNNQLLHILERAKNKGNELVLFDINRRPRLEPFFRADVMTAPRLITSTKNHSFELTVVTNRNPDTDEIITRTRVAHGTAITERDPGLAWPKTIITLSHTAIPFPYDDPIYGPGDSPDGTRHATIGNLIVRAERGSLTISPETLLRMRANPFYKLVEDRVIERLPAQP